jgi:hypothetical protein
MGWDPAQVARYGADLLALAGLKYDEYERYLPGVKFLESLAGCLSDLNIDQRRTIVRFVLEDLIFMSRTELDHLIDAAYPDRIRRMLVEMVAAQTGESPFAVLASLPRLPSAN